MSYVTEAFAAPLLSAMEASANTLPISEEAEADLLALLSDEDAYTFASIKGDTTFETIKIYVSADTLLVERGLGGTTACAHTCGATVCLVAPTTVEVIKDLLCNYDCCADDGCDCTAVSLAGSSLPPAVVGTAWTGVVIYDGDTPMLFADGGVPSWMTVTTLGRAVSLSGTPTRAGSYTFSLAASNCDGKYLTGNNFTVTVTTE